ncbi:MAG: PKD domain-containing protein [Thermoplasmata archaeon]|nr:PKD domain-containing protein [Thermoplasmata archaeon]
MLRPGEGYWVCVTEDCIWKQGTEGRIIHPNGGEYLGGTVPITWACFIGHPKVDLFYSDDNGTNWYLIASNETDDGFFLWNTTIAPETTTALIKIVTETGVIDISDSTFTIDNTAPAASILINNDAKYVSGEQVYPDPVTLDLFALDNIEGSGAYKYRLKTAQRLSTGGYKESDWTQWFYWPDPAFTNLTYENFNLGKGYWSIRWVYLQVKDNAGNIAGEDPDGIENAPGSIYDTIIFLNPNQPIPYIEVLTYQEVNITLRVEGREGNTVTIIIYEDDRPIDGLRVTREPGNPDEQSKTLTLRVYTSILSDGTNVTYTTRHYDVQLIYNSAGAGANPVKLIFESENNVEVINTWFNSAQGLAQEEWFDIDEILNETLLGNRRFHFQTPPHSTCQWNFGDGTNDTGMNVQHTYSDLGSYIVTLLYVNEPDDIIATIEFEIKVT